MGTDASSFWEMSGEAISVLIPRNRRIVQLPAGLHRLPGPALVVAQRFVDSPVGPFMCVSVGEPARVGLRAGFFFGVSAVDNPEVRRMARHLWGFVHEVGRLSWSSDAASRSLEWDERGLRVSAEVSRVRMPLLMPGRAVQRRSDGPVLVPTKVSGVARRALVEFAVPDDDELSALIGVRRGHAIDGLALRRRPARAARKPLPSLRRPATSPEPGVIGMESSSSAP